VKTKFATSVVAAMATLASGLGAGAVAAQTGAEFFDGKAVQYIVATDTGGGYDMNGRPVAHFMQKHFPGSTVIARNMPAPGILLASTISISRSSLSFQARPRHMPAIPMATINPLRPGS
jgi:tripartite-type tricarboxylate transporter receptor subunit TctC